MTRHIHPRSGSLDISLHTLDGLAQRARGAHLARLAEIPPAEGFLETQDGAPVHRPSVHLMPCTDYVRIDWEKGWTARREHAERAERCARRREIARHMALAAIVIGLAIWGLWA